MTTQVPKKADMIRSLLQAGELQEFKADTEKATLQKIYRKVDSDKLKDMYMALQNKSVEEVVESINQEVKAVVKDPMYEVITNEEGLTAKRWVIEILDEFKFSKAKGSPSKRYKVLNTADGNKLIYRFNTNSLIYMDGKSKHTIKSTLMLCEFICRSFIVKYSAK